MTHVVLTKPIFNKVDTGRVPFVSRLTLFKPDVAASVKFSHKSTNVLLADTVYLLLGLFKYTIKYFQFVFFVLNPALDVGLFVLNLLHKLLSGN
jgi:hypothetical protein